MAAPNPNPNPTRQQVTHSILKRYFQRWLTRISMDEIFPGIYLGGSYAAENISTLTTKNISFVISIMSKNLPPSTREAYMDKRIEHVYIKKRDETDEDILAVLGEMCRLIEVKSQGGRGVLLHCAMGVSRSATIMAAYGMLSFYFCSVASFSLSGQTVIYICLLTYSICE